MKYTIQNNTEFAKTIADPAVQFLDVRTPEEYAEGYIPGAVNQNVQHPDFVKQASILDKNRPVAVYCRSGARSKAAASKLSALGYTVYDLDRGILGWNGPVIKK